MDWDGENQWRLTFQPLALTDWAPGGQRDRLPVVLGGTPGSSRSARTAASAAICPDEHRRLNASPVFSRREVDRFCGRPGTPRSSSSGRTARDSGA
jgi:hypothetical protein